MNRGQIPDTFIQELLSRADITEVVGRYVSLKKGGINLLGLCPFHGEKTPSFTVSPSKQFYHCFGCGAHGDALRFLMEHNGLGFVDAVHDLAQQVGLQVPQARVDPEEQERASQARAREASLTATLQRAGDHYRQCLKDNPRAIDYLKRRGLTGDVARHFGLGYAPEGWRTLAGVFPRYDDSSLVDSGLVILQGEEGSDQKRYDRFRDRIMFPIRSVKGDLIGFGGRVLDGGEPKYLNSPETPVFVKGRELYGLFEARQAIRERGYALVVEGYMDVVALAQSGFGNAVATLGTACTADHVRKLLRFTDHVVFSFDGDAAGRRAAGRALEAALPHVTDVRSFRFLFLPDEHDPDSFVRTHGADAFEQQVQAAIPLSAQLIDLASAETDLSTAEGRARMLAQARPLWTALPDGALRTQILANLSEVGRIPADELSRLWGVARTPARSRTPAPRIRATRGAALQVQVRQPQDHAARMLLLDLGLWDGLDALHQEELSRLETWHGALFRWLERTVTEHGALPWPQLREHLAGEPFGSQAVQLVDGADLAPVADAAELQGALQQMRLQGQKLESLRLLGRV